MSDLISRQRAIDEISRWLGYLDDDMILRIQIGLRKLPSAQPVATDTNVGDTISRQAAIDALDCINGVEEVLRSLPSAQTFEIQEILDYLDTKLHPIISPEHWNIYSELHDMISTLPSAQPKHTCLTCGRTANNGGWYEDGRTRCPIEEHYALPKDGHCHLWEKQKVWEDDYPERREDE